MKKSSNWMQKWVSANCQSMTKTAYDTTQSRPHERLLPGENPPGSRAETTPYLQADPYNGKPKAKESDPYPVEPHSTFSDNVTSLLRRLTQRQTIDESNYATYEQLNNEGISSSTISKALAKGLVKVEPSLDQAGGQVVTLTPQGSTAWHNFNQANDGSPYEKAENGLIKRDETGKAVPNNGDDRALPDKSPWSSKNLRNKLDRGTGLDSLENDANSMLASVKKETKVASQNAWMQKWVLNNCKFAQQYNSGGPKSKDSAGFHRMFEQWIAADNLQEYLTEFEAKHGLLPGVPLSIPQAFEFMKEGDVPEWAQEYCPDHDFQYNSRNDTEYCTVCGQEGDRPMTAQDRIDMEGDRKYDEMVDRSLTERM